jgi:hypothetical protein
MAIRHKDANMRMDARGSVFVIAGALMWLSAIPGRAGAS